MSAGSVSTPTRTTTTTPTTPARGSKPTSTTPPTRDPDDRSRTSGQMPAIRNAAAIAQAVTGERDIEGRAAGEAVLRAMNGDNRSTGSRTTLEIRRDGTLVGSRDARQAILETERADLAKQYATGDGRANAELDRQMQRVSQELRASRGMNAVADTLHVLGADDYNAGVLEDEKRVRVVADDRLAGSAGYDHESHSILVSQSLADQAATAADALYRQGVFDARGRIVKGREDDLDTSVYGDQLIKVGTLISYHEQKHAEQDFIGGLGQFVEGAAPAVADLSGTYDAISVQAHSEGLGIEIPEWETTDDAWAIETLRVHGEEYDAYLAQERADIALGASVKVQLVTDAAGNPLERGKAVENIVDMERGRALRNGPDAGWLRDDVLKGLMADAGTDPASVPWNPSEIAGHGATIIGETPGWKRPGWKRPGWKRPGMMIE